MLLAGIAIQLESYRRSQRLLIQILDRQKRDRQRAEALFSLFSLIKITHPLPATTIWTIAPDFANLLISLIATRRPTRIVELGSGLSTLIAGYYLKQLGCGSIISIEHEEQVAAATARQIQQHGLEDVASVIHAPLRDVTIDGQSWRWYDLDSLAGIQQIDLLVVDGPPAQLQPRARYPALPMLHDRLSAEAAILFDDGVRPDEHESAAAIKTLYDQWRANELCVQPDWQFTNSFDRRRLTGELTALLSEVQHEAMLHR